LTWLKVKKPSRDSSVGMTMLAQAPTPYKSAIKADADTRSRDGRGHAAILRYSPTGNERLSAPTSPWFSCPAEEAIDRRTRSKEMRQAKEPGDESPE
jgi:hypothetical protein